MKSNPLKSRRTNLERPAAIDAAAGPGRATAPASVPAAGAARPSTPATDDTVDALPPGMFDTEDTVAFGPPQAQTWATRAADRIDSVVSGALARLWRPAPPPATRSSGMRKR